jgi:flagellar biosynthesis component FlhA
MWTNDGSVAPDPQVALYVRDAIARYAAEPAAAPHAVIVTAPLRPLLAEFLDRAPDGVAVYAYGELPPEVALEPVAVLDGAARREQLR